MLHQHFGHMLVSCDKADLRPTPTSMGIHGDETQIVETLRPPRVPRTEVIDELFRCVTEGTPALHSGEWARATTEVCLAILESARSGADCSLQFQVAPSAS